MAGTDMLQHPFGLGVGRDGFSRDRLQVVDLQDAPAFGLGVVLGSLLVVLWAVTPGLVLGGDPDPDADRFRILGGFHILAFMSQYTVIAWKIKL